MEDDYLGRRDVVGPLAALHLLLHLCDPLAVDAVELYNSGKCHLSLLVVS